MGKKECAKYFAHTSPRNAILLRVALNSGVFAFSLSIILLPASVWLLIVFYGLSKPTVTLFGSKRDSEFTFAPDIRQRPRRIGR